MEIKLKHNLQLYKQQLITIDIYILPLILFTYIISLSTPIFFKAATIVLITLFIVVNLLFITFIMIYKDYVIISNEYIIIKVNKKIEKIEITDIKSIETYKAKWYDYLLNYFTSSFLITFKNGKTKNNICFTNKQIDKIKEYTVQSGKNNFIIFH